MPERTNPAFETQEAKLGAELQLDFTDFAEDLPIAPAEIEAIKRLLGDELLLLLNP